MTRNQDRSPIFISITIMMAYPIQTIEAFGSSYVEYRYEPDRFDEVSEPQIVTIEFTPQTHPLDDYSYTQPKFVFGDVVALKEQYDYCCENHIDLAEELDYFPVCALELVEPKSKLGRLTDSPSWLIGIRCDTGTREVMWFDEEELISKRAIEQEHQDLNEF